MPALQSSCRIARGSALQEVGLSVTCRISDLIWQHGTDVDEKVMGRLITARDGDVGVRQLGQRGTCNNYHVAVSSMARRKVRVKWKNLPENNKPRGLEVRKQADKDYTVPSERLLTVLTPLDLRTSRTQMRTRTLFSSIRRTRAV